MVLPLVLGLLGSYLGSAGMVGGLGALAAGAIGSGVGSAIEEGDIAAGIRTGLTSFMGGQVLGSLMGGASSQAVAAGTTPSLSGTAADAVTKSAGSGGLGGMFGQDNGFGKFLGSQFQDPTKGIQASMFSKELLPYVAGSQAGNVAQMALGGGYGGIPDASDNSNLPKLGKTPPRINSQPPPGYSPGIDPEFNYMFPTTYAEGGIVSLGKGSPAQGQGVPQEDIMAVVAAIQGGVADPQAILAEFLQKYGEQALRQIIEMVMQGGMQQGQPPQQPARDGMSDSVPASVDGKQPAALSEGEFVVPSDVVSDLGNGSTDAGAGKLHEMMARVRESRRGMPVQPPRIDPTAMMPA